MACGQNAPSFWLIIAMMTVSIQPLSVTTKKNYNHAIIEDWVNIYFYFGLQQGPPITCLNRIQQIRSGSRSRSATFAHNFEAQFGAMLHTWKCIVSAIWFILDSKIPFFNAFSQLSQNSYQLYRTQCPSSIYVDKIALDFCNKGRFYLCMVSK